MELKFTIYVFCFLAIGAIVESSRVTRFGRQTAYNSHQLSDGPANDNRPILIVVNSKPSAHSFHHRPSHSSSDEDLTRSGVLMKFLRLPRTKQIVRSSDKKNLSHNMKMAKKVKHNLRTQMLKDLLSLRNSLRCRRQYECKSECYNEGASNDNSQGDNCDCGCQCEKEFECDQDYLDQSGCSAEDDECGVETNPSTKAFF